MTSKGRMFRRAPHVLTFLLRHGSQACWTWRRFTGMPSWSEATNLTGRFCGGSAMAG